MAEIDVFEKSFGSDSLLGPTFVNIGLLSYGCDDGGVLLSPDLATDMEIDESVDYLIKQLERARKKAKKILKKYKKARHN